MTKHKKRQGVFSDGGIPRDFFDPRQWPEHGHVVVYRRIADGARLYACAECARAYPLMGVASRLLGPDAALLFDLAGWHQCSSDDEAMPKWSVKKRVDKRF